MVNCVIEHNAETRSKNVVHIYYYIITHVPLDGVFEELSTTMHGTENFLLLLTILFAPFYFSTIFGHSRCWINLQRKPQKTEFCFSQMSPNILVQTIFLKGYFNSASQKAHVCFTGVPQKFIFSRKCSRDTETMKTAALYDG